MQAATPTIAMEIVLEDELDFGQIVREYRGGLMALAYDLTGNRHDAEDLAQEVFIKAHRHLHTFRGDSGIYAWLRRIAVNTHLNRKRKKAVRFMHLFGDVVGADKWESRHAPPDRDAADSDTRGHIDRALDGLSPRERTAFVMRHYHDMSTREVAAAMDIADGTVKSLVFRATTKLRDSLQHLRQEA